MHFSCLDRLGSKGLPELGMIHAYTMASLMNVFSRQVPLPTNLSSCLKYVVLLGEDLNEEENVFNPIANCYVLNIL